MPRDFYSATRSFVNDVADHPSVCLPFFFVFSLVGFEEEVVWAENRHFVYFHDLEEATTAGEYPVVNVVKDARAHAGLAPKVVVKDALGSDRVQSQESSTLKSYHLAIGGASFSIDAQLDRFALVSQSLALNYVLLRLFTAC